MHQTARHAVEGSLRTNKEIDRNGMWGVNILTAVTDFDGLVKEAVNGGVKFIAAGAGPPLRLPELTVAHPEIALIPIVSSVPGVRIMCGWWKRHYNRLPDAIIIETPSAAGGHLGVTRNQKIDDEELKLEFVIPESRKYLEKNNWNIPLIAAGGIWDRSDIDRMLKLGASGVQMATRFVCTRESGFSSEFKETYINSTPESIKIIESPVGGLPGRAIWTEFLDQVERGEIHDHCSVNCLTNCVCRDKREKYCIVKALVNALNGDVNHGIVFAGTKAPLAKKDGLNKTVQQIFDELKRS